MARGDLYYRLRGTQDDIDRFSDDTRQPFNEKIPICAFAADTGYWASRGDWDDQQLDNSMLPNKAAIIADYNLSPDEEQDLDDLIALARTAVDINYWRTKWIDSLHSVESQIRFQTVQEWQDFLQECAKFDPSLATSPLGR